MILATALTMASATTLLAQGELVKFVSGDGSWDSGCGVIRWSAEFAVQRVNGAIVSLYLDCPEMQPTIPKVGDVCRVTYTLGPIESVIRRDPFSATPEGDQIIIDELDCGPHTLKPDIWDTPPKDTP